MLNNPSNTSQLGRTRPFLSFRGNCNIAGQLAKKRERNGEANYFSELAKGHFKLCAHDIIMFMVNIIVGDSECMA